MSEGNLSMSQEPLLLIGEAPLTLASVAAIARRGVRLELSPRAQDQVRAGRAVVEDVVTRGVAAYGVNTGVGSQKDFAVDRDALARYNNLLITGHATMAPGENASRAVVRAALGIQLAQFATGRSGVRPELVQSLLARLQADDLPDARLGSSIGASDIVAMSQLAVPLIGKAGVGPGGAGPRPIAGLAAKEALSLLNSNCLMLAEGTLAILEVRALLDAWTRVCSLSMEAFRGNLTSWSAPVDVARGQPGQLRVGAALRAVLANSQLWRPGEARFLQDPLSFRCIPQIHGAAEAAYDFAHQIFETEVSAACDNPMIDLGAATFISHGNMESTACALAMDTLRQALAKVVVTAGERVHKLQWPNFSGLPTGLAPQSGAIGGVQFLNLGHIAAAGVGAVRQAAHAALLGYQGQVCDGVEDVAGNGPQSVGETVRALRPAWTVLAVEAVCAAWAVDRRGLAIEALGEGLRDELRAIRDVLPIGREGVEVFDLGVVVELLRRGQAAG